MAQRFDRRQFVRTIGTAGSLGQVTHHDRSNSKA